MALILEGYDLLGGVLFAVLVNMKHLFASLGPLYFVYLFRHYCRQALDLWYHEHEFCTSWSVMQHLSFRHILILDIDEQAYLRICQVLVWHWSQLV